MQFLQRLYVLMFFLQAKDICYLALFYREVDFWSILKKWSKILMMQLPCILSLQPLQV